jgi:hypothetical protein
MTRSELHHLLYDMLAATAMVPRHLRSRVGRHVAGRFRDHDCAGSVWGHGGGPCSYPCADLLPRVGALEMIRKARRRNAKHASVWQLARKIAAIIMWFFDIATLSASLA